MKHSSSWQKSEANQTKKLSRLTFCRVGEKRQILDEKRSLIHKSSALLDDNWDGAKKTSALQIATSSFIFDKCRRITATFPTKRTSKRAYIHYIHEYRNTSQILHTVLQETSLLYGPMGFGNYALFTIF